MSNVLMNALVQGAVSACAFLIIFFQLPWWKRMIAYSVIIDMAFTAALVWLWHGTMTGMFAAMIAGVLVSIVLFIAKKGVAANARTHEASGL